MNNLALNMVDVLESIDDADTDHEETTQLSVPDSRSKSCKFCYCFTPLLNIHFKSIK